MPLADSAPGPDADVLERVRELLQAIDRPVVLVEPDGEIIALNRAAELAGAEAVAGSAAAHMGEVLQEQATELEMANEELQAIAEELEERTAAAEAGERELRTMLESITDAFVAIDEEGRFSYVNDHAERLLRRPRAELLDREVWSVFPQGAGSRFEAEYERARRERVTARYEQYSPAMGVWFEVHVYPSESGLSVYFRDVTERHEAAARLHDSEQRYRLLFERHPLPMWLFDVATLRFLAVNEAAVEQYGYSREEFLGMTIEQIRPAHVLPELRAALSGENARRHRAGRFVHRLRDGSLREVEIVSHGIEMDGRLARLVLALDVTDRLAAERTLREREEQLRQAQKMEAVGRLAGGVAHDFNNLLTVITGNLGFARAELPPDSPAHPDLEEVAGAAERAATLTRQLLAVSRKQLLHPRLLDMGQAVAQAQRLLQRVIGEDILLELSVPNQVWPVHADPGQVDQVLLNLVMNARDAMPAGGTITVEVENVLLGAEDAGSLDVSVEAGAYVAVTVHDGGAGMDPATREHAVEPFFTTKPAGRGTGLGLSTVYGIVTQSGGGLRIESEQGAGTSVSVFLPRADGRVAPGAPESLASARGYGQRILVVEDEAPVRGVIRRTLERHGYVVLEARHGADALLVWEDARSTLSMVVTDIVMPELGGRELAARLRADRPEIPILFLSGYAGGAGGVGNSPLAPGEPFLQKPFAGGELLRQVEILLARRESAGLPAQGGS